MAGVTDAALNAHLASPLVRVFSWTFTALDPERASVVYVNERVFVPQYPLYQDTGRLLEAVSRPGFAIRFTPAAWTLDVKIVNRKTEDNK